MRKTAQSHSSFVRERKIGEITVLLPKPPQNKEEIMNYGLPPSQQRWTPPQIPKNFYTLPEEEQKEFLKQELLRRREGFWFYNAGNLEYMTGAHYFYCTYWKIDVGLPQWRDSDRDFYYFWQHCSVDEDCFGMIDIEGRRGGKTWRGCEIVYETISKTEESNGGIQSKTREDAKKVFGKLISCWKKLPDFWKPTDTGETRPSQVLRFEEPAVRSSKGKRKVYKQVLNSQIDFQPATEEAYDGTKQKIMYHDEIGKTVEVDVDVRWTICKECLAIGNRIIGKAILTTTVEEMTKKGGENCYKIWLKSDPNERKGDGRTPSGLYRYFKPAYFGLEGFIDEYGYSDQEGAKKYLESKRDGLEGADLSAEKRLYPFTPEEAFRVDNKESPFDLDRIYTQKEENVGLPPNTIVRGNFIWITEDEEAGFVNDPNGKWRVAWMPQDRDVEVRNKYEIRYGKRRPGNTAHVCAGVDPFDHKKTTDGRKSDASCHIRRKFDPMNPHKTKCFVAHYLARPPKPEIFFEDILIACFFYGCEILPETNKIGLNNHFRVRGYDKYLMMRPDPTHTGFSSKNQKEPGIPMTGDAARTALIEAIQTEVYDNCGWIDEQQRFAFNPFDETLQDWIEFDTENWTPHDSTVSSGLALLAERKYQTKPKRNPEGVQTFTKVYDIRGVVGKRLR